MDTRSSSPLEVMTGERAGLGNLVNTNVLNWKHLDENISRKLLEWVYLGTPLINDQDTDEESLEILKVARSLGLTEMKLKCKIVDLL